MVALIVRMLTGNKTYGEFVLEDKSGTMCQMVIVMEI